MLKKILFLLGVLILPEIILADIKIQAEPITFTGKSQTDVLNELKADLKNMENVLLTLSAQEQKMEKELEKKNKKRMRFELNYIKAESEVRKFENKVLSVQNRMEEQSDQLKQRAQSLQEIGINKNYLEVLVDSANHKDKVDTQKMFIPEAYRLLLKQLETDKTFFENQKESLEIKLASVAQLNITLKKMQDQFTGYQLKYKEVLAQIEKIQYDKKRLLESILEYKPKRSPITGSERSTKDYAQTVVAVGKKHIGNSTYVFGGGRSKQDIANGRFDCSAFVHWAFAQAGIEVGMITDTLKHSGEQVSFDEIQPGDLVFFDTYKKDGHVGIYIGGGKFIGAQSATGVAIEDLTTGYWQDTFNGRVIRI